MALYAEINDRIVRYALKAGRSRRQASAEVDRLSGMPITGDHPMHPFTIDAEGNLFVSMGSATNTCEVKNRMPHSPGNDPCTELETRAGIWRYDANKHRPGVLAEGALCHGHPQRRGLATSTPAGASSSPSTAATSCTRTGPSSTRPSRALSCRPRR